MATTTNTSAPASASIFRTGRATKLEAAYRALGLKVQIEVGMVGLVVYGASRATVDAVASALLTAIRMRDPRGEVEHVGEELDEPAETRWYATLTFDWSRFDAASGSVAA